MKKFLSLLAICSLILGTPLATTAAYIVPATSTTSVNPDDAVKKAVGEFKSLSRSEKRSRIKNVKKAIKDYKAEKASGAEPSTNTLLLVILAILLPPLAVYLYEGEINTRFWISLILTLLFFIPGVIYALILILGNK